MTITALDHPGQHGRHRSRAAAVAIVGITFLAYGMVGPASAAYADSTVTTPAELVADFTGATASTTITLGGDIALAPTDGALVAPDNVQVTIDLAGNNLEVEAPQDYPGLLVGVQSDVSIVDLVGGGALTLVGGEAPSSTANAGPGLRVAGTATISVAEASIIGGDSGVGWAGYGITVAGGTLTIDGTEMVVTGSAGATVTSGYGMIMVGESNVALVGGSNVRFSVGAGSDGAHGISNGAESVLRVIDSGLTISGVSGSAYDLLNEGATIISNGGFDASRATAVNVSNDGTFVSVDSTLIVGSFGGDYNVPAALDGNGGTPAEVIVYGESVNHGLDLLTGPSNVWPPVRAGYTFTGWFSDPTGGFEVPADSFDNFIEVTSTAYAQWAADAVVPPVDPAPELAATGVTIDSGAITAGVLLLLGLLTIGCATVVRRRV